MLKKISNMSNDEFETFARERMRLEGVIDNKSLLIGLLGEDRKCPFCNNITTGKSLMRKELLQLMREFNEFLGRKYYISHHEGNKKWSV